MLDHMDLGLSQELVYFVLITSDSPLLPLMQFGVGLLGLSFAEGVHYLYLGFYTFAFFRLFCMHFAFKHDLSVFIRWLNTVGVLGFGEVFIDVCWFCF